MLKGLNMQIAPNLEAQSALAGCSVHKTATTPATAITAAARLPIPCAGAPPVDSGTEGPVREAEPLAPAALAAPEASMLPLARTVDVMPDSVAMAAVVVITEVFVQEQEES